MPFFTISGSDFVEMFVGVGASRVRDMFEQAKKNAPCIIFIDEIDAVGRHRGAGLGGGNDEREQTLNQLLVEMDGFEANEGVILIAATNRPDVLDPALLRPGRFDRQVVVPNPDIIGREKILKVHMRKVPLAPDVDPKVIARGTPGFSGADLANLVNEAALLAARARKRLVTQQDFEDAKDKVMMGAERRSMVMTEEEKTLTAYHEAGHALVGLHQRHHDPLHKVTIIPRGRALGVVMSPAGARPLSYTRGELEADLAMLLGGRVAEELIFGPEKVTTGASDDIQHGDQHRPRHGHSNMACRDKLGPLRYSENEEEVFLGHSVTQRRTSRTRRRDARSTRRSADWSTRPARPRAADPAENIDELHAVARRRCSNTRRSRATRSTNVLNGEPIRARGHATEPAHAAPPRRFRCRRGKSAARAGPRPGGLEPQPQPRWPGPCCDIFALARLRGEERLVTGCPWPEAIGSICGRSASSAGEAAAQAVRGGAAGRLPVAPSPLPLELVEGAPGSASGTVSRLRMLAAVADADLDRPA